MATRAAQKRLTREYKALQENPNPYIETHPNEENILEWYYIIDGPPDTPYEGGQYMGTLTFPADYPFNPPAIRMLTPSGRFEPGSRLCLSISDFHPKTWNPSWSVATILVGLLSFMTGTENTAGSITSSEHQKKRLAAASKLWNLKNDRFKRQYPELAKEQEGLLQVADRADKTSTKISKRSWVDEIPPWLLGVGVAVVVGVLYKAA